VLDARLSTASSSVCGSVALAKSSLNMYVALELLHVKMIIELESGFMIITIIIMIIIRQVVR
jgi:hypothetical protein